MMKVKDIIKDLTDLDEVWVKGKIERLGGSDYHLVIAFNNRRCFFSRNDEIELEKSVGDKIEIPQFLADHFNNNPNFDIDSLLDYQVLENNGEDEIISWLYDNDTSEKNKRYLIACRAYVEGYTVEEPKRWVVKDSKGKLIPELTINYTDSTFINTDNRGIDPLKFTDRKKAEAVALLIDGEVEEV